MKQARIVVAGTQSSSGKTSVTLALMSSLRKAGCRVQGFKVGPDYIDPGYHGAATGVPSHNLDAWLLSHDTLRWVFQTYSAGADISIIEGVMGLFDGFGSRDDTASTAQVAKWLKAPVLLVLDGKSMARSAAATVLGYKNFDPDLKIAGVILNKVGSESHYQLLKESIETYTKIPVLGALLRDDRVHVPERHLGLKTVSENEQMKSCMEALMELAKCRPEKGQPGIDLQKIVTLAQSVPLLPQVKNPLDEAKRAEKTTIGVAKDRAFSFYYEANFDVLQQLDAELAPFSPLEDEKLPQNVSALYFGGGFPELFAAELQDNEPLKNEIRQCVVSGMPIYAECGGLMYLSRSIETRDGKPSTMTGIIPAQIIMTEKLQNFGYKEGQCYQCHLLGDKEQPIRGHEFHYSRCEYEERAPAYTLVHRRTGKTQTEGFVHGSLLASYLHVHFLSRVSLAENFIKHAAQWQRCAYSRKQA